MGSGSTVALTLVGMLFLWCIHARNRVRPYRATYTSATIHLETQRSALEQALGNLPQWADSEGASVGSDAPLLLRWVRENNGHLNDSSGVVLKHAERVSFAIQQSNAARRALHHLLSNPGFLPDLLISGSIKAPPIEELEVQTDPIRGFV